MSTPEPIIITEPARGQLFSLQYTAKMARIGRNTLWRYIKKGAIPPFHYNTPQGHSLLTLEQLQAIVLGFRMIREKRLNRKDLNAFLLRYWDRKPGDDAGIELPKKRKKRDKPKRSPKRKRKPKPRPVGRPRKAVKKKPRKRKRKRKKAPAMQRLTEKVYLKRFRERRKTQRLKKELTANPLPDGLLQAPDNHAGEPLSISGEHLA